MVTSCVTHRMGTGLGAGGLMGGATTLVNNTPGRYVTLPYKLGASSTSEYNVCSLECVSDMIMNVSRHSDYFANCGHDTDYIA